MATPGSSFTPIPLGHEDNLEDLFSTRFDSFQEDKRKNAVLFKNPSSISRQDVPCYTPEFQIEIIDLQHHITLKKQMCRPSISRLLTIWLKEFSWPPSDQQMTITSTKTEPAFIRKHNRSPLRPPMSIALAPLALHTAMV
ncbi:hypothetical protein TNCV_194451 [Trichonephila clavipes]|nr:hypothetical protein TNCV_194451 [Trichonephila clavipes]